MQGNNRRVSAVVRLESDSRAPSCRKEEADLVLEETIVFMIKVATKESIATGAVHLEPVITIDGGYWLIQNHDVS